MSRIEKRDDDVAAVHSSASSAARLWDDDAEQEHEDWTERRETLRYKSWRGGNGWKHYIVDEEQPTAWVFSDTIAQVKR